MDIKRVIPLLALLAVFVWGGIKLKKGFTALMATDVHKVEDSVGSLPLNLNRSGFAQYVRQPKVMTEEIKLSGISKECEAYVNAIEGIDLTFHKDSSFHLSYQQLTEPTSGCSLTDDRVALNEKDYLSKCFLINPTRSDTPVDGCIQSIYVLRSSMTRMLERNKKISEIETLGKLTDLLYSDVMASVSPTDPQPLDMVRAESIVDQMLELNSGLKAAKRAKYVMLARKTIIQATTKTLKDQETLWDDLHTQYAKLRNQGAFDEGSVELDAMIETHGYNPALTLRYGSDILAKSPNSAWGELLIAYGHWKADDQEAAFKEVRKVVELDPKNEDYQRLLNQLTQSGVGEEAFVPVLKSTLVPQDFDK
jgi:hypothetical protein